jgi:hypothetical protein
MKKPSEVVLWHDNDIILTIENCDVTLCIDNTDLMLPYRWLELETGQKFAELDGWHYRLKYGKTWITGWEEVYEDKK